MVKKELMGLGVIALLAAIFGGVIAYILGMALSGIAVMTVGPIILALLGIGIALFLASKSKIDNWSFFRLVMLFGMIGVVGSVITMIVPATAFFILSVEQFTWVGLIWTFVYIMLAELTGSKLGIKV